MGTARVALPWRHQKQIQRRTPKITGDRYKFKTNCNSGAAEALRPGQAGAQQAAPLLTMHRGCETNRNQDYAALAKRMARAFMQ
jgi:hypothetical protein